MRGILIGGMVLGLLLGYNNGLADELAVEKRLGEIGRSTENAFYEFIGLIADSLDFTVKADTTKKQVGQHFITLGTKLEQASVELEKVAEKAVTDDDKEGLLSKAIKESVDTAKTTLSTLKVHLEALKKIGDGDKVGEVKSDHQGVAANPEKLKAVHKALKGIVDEAGKAGVDKLKDSYVTLADTSIGGASPQNGAKILATGGSKPSDGEAALAASIVSLVSGEAILAAIVSSPENDTTLDSRNANGQTSALRFAKGDSDPNKLAQTTVLAGAVSGRIALRSLVKEGKLAANSSNDNKGVEIAGISATNKLLGAIEDIIRETMKKIFDKVKKEIDSTKNSKVTIQ